MGISDLIAAFIQQALDEADDGILELQRATLAERFHCVPSQINYVMSTRFSPERGYIVESRRGGNGYIRITRVKVDHETLIVHVINSISDSIDERSAKAIVDNLLHVGAISEEAAKLLKVAVLDKVYVCPDSSNDLSKMTKDMIRAGILKNMLILLT